MRNIFKIFSALALFMFLFSCKDRDSDPRISTDAVSVPVITQGASGTFTVTAANLASVFQNFVITPASYGTPISLVYQFQISEDGKNWKPVSDMRNSFTDTATTVTYQELNNALANLGLSANEKHTVLVRLKATPASALVNPSYSDPIKFTVVPYEPNYDIIFPKLCVPGNYGAASGYSDWTPQNGGSPNLFSAKSDGVYTGFIWMNNAAPNFKFTYAEEGWGNNKGDTADPNTYTTIVANGQNITGKTANSSYYFKVDWVNNTYSMQAVNIGMIGDAVPSGWATPDNKLTFNNTTKKYTISSIALAANKAFKFRINDDWAMKIQPAAADMTLVSAKASQVFNSAEGTVSGDPAFMVAEAGNYKIELDLHNSGHYTITVTKL